MEAEDIFKHYRNDVNRAVSELRRKTGLNFVLDESTVDLLPTYGVVVSAASGGTDIDDDGAPISINSVTIRGALLVRDHVLALTSAPAQVTPSSALASAPSVTPQGSSGSSA